MDLDVCSLDTGDDIVIPEINILNKDECVQVLQEVVDPRSPSLNYGLDLYRLAVNTVDDIAQL